jgi:hypothetical protein
MPAYYIVLQYKGTAHNCLSCEFFESYIFDHKVHNSKNINYKDDQITVTTRPLLPASVHKSSPQPSLCCLPSQTST